MRCLERKPACPSISEVKHSKSNHKTAVSPELVHQHNPQCIFKLTASTDAVNASYYQDILNSVNTHPLLSDVATVKSGNAYTFDYTIIPGLRYPVGLLYFAKNMHSDLSTDTDPTTILPDMIEQFFKITLSGAYLYP